MNIEYLELDSIDRVMRRQSRQIVSRAFLILAAVAFAVGCSDTAPQTTDPEIQSFELAIKERSVALSGDAIRVRQGQQVKLSWLTDEPTSIHLHGYDIEASLEPNTPVSWTFEANATGRFPIEAHGFGQLKEPAQAHDHSHDHDHPSPRSPDTAIPADVVLMYFEVYPR